jgi:DNA-binding transcriptional ArsR family regulator
MIQINGLEEGLELFKTLGSEVRMNIVELLSEKGEMNLNEIAGALGLTNGALTSHIRKLEECGVIRVAPENTGHGNQKRCSLKVDQILLNVMQEHEISDIAFRTWLKPLTVHRVTDNTVILLVPTGQMGIDYITKKYLFPLKVAITEMTGTEYDIQFILQDEAREENLRHVNVKQPETPGENPKIRMVLMEAGLNPKYTFETFVVGSNNKFAHAAAVAVAESNLACSPRPSTSFSGVMRLQSSSVRDLSVRGSWIMMPFMELSLFARIISSRSVPLVVQISITSIPISSP